MEVVHPHPFPNLHLKCAIPLQIDITYNPDVLDGNISWFPGDIPFWFEWQGMQYNGLLNYLPGMGQHI